MCNNRVLSINNCGIVTALIEHTGINAQNICKIYGTVKRSFIRADDDQMILVDNQILFGTEQRTDKLIGWCEVIKAT